MAEEHLKLEAQEALDELWNELRLPFKLKAFRVEPIEDVLEGYRVDFFDSRFRSMFVRWSPDREPFKAAVREVVERWASERVLTRKG